MSYFLTGIALKFALGLRGVLSSSVVTRIVTTSAENKCTVYVSLGGGGG